MRFASLEALITNMVRSIYHDPKKGKIEYTSPGDFMVKWGAVENEQKPEPKKQSAEEMKGIMLGIANVMNKKKKQ